MRLNSMKNCTEIKTPLSDTGFSRDLPQSVPVREGVLGLESLNFPIFALGSNPLNYPEFGKQDLECFLHWLQGVCCCPSLVFLNAFVDVVTSFTHGVTTIQVGKPSKVGFDMYSNTIESSCGSKFAYHQFDDDFGYYRLFFSVTGLTLESMGVEKALQLLLSLQTLFAYPNSHNVRFAADIALLPSDYLFLRWSRIDCKARVSDSLLSAVQCYMAVTEGNYSGFKTSTFAGEIKERVQTFTLYCGSFQSDSLVCIYNPYHCHKIAAATDIETRFKDGKAHKVAEVLSLGFDDLSSRLEAFLGLVIGQVRFIDRTSGDTPARCNDLPFWDNFLSFCKSMPIKIYAPPVTFSLDRSKKWIVEQVLATLATVTLSVNPLIDLYQENIDHRVIVQAIDDYLKILKQLLLDKIPYLGFKHKAMLKQYNLSNNFT